MLILPYSMQKSLSCESKLFASSQGIPCILWKRNVNYRTHKRPSPVPIVGQPNPVHIPNTHIPRPGHQS